MSGEHQDERHRVRADPSARGTRVACATCGVAVDPFRADCVAHIRGRFRYFCSAECRQRYTPDLTHTPLPLPRDRRTPISAPFTAPRPLDAPALEPRSPSDSPDARRSPRAPAYVDVPSDAGREPRVSNSVVPGSPPSRTLLSLASGAAAGGALTFLLGSSGPVLSLRAVLILVAALALFVRLALTRHTPADPSPLWVSAPPALTSFAAFGAYLFAPELAPRALSLAAVTVLATAASQWLVESAREDVQRQLLRIRERLDVVAHRIVDEEVVETFAADLRPGEEIVIEAGEVVPADATITAGSGEVLPWLGASQAESRKEGAPLVAGAQVQSGRLRAVVAWTADDRAWMRLTHDPARRADLVGPLAVLARHLVLRGAAVVLLTAALAAYSSGATWAEGALSVIAAFSAIAGSSAIGFTAMHVARGIVGALSRGIAFRTAEAFDQAGRVSAAVFCARGTLLLGEPDVASIDPLRGYDAARVLSLVAGAESSSVDPGAVALLRAARARGVVPDGVRTPQHLPGLGVTAVASTGEPLVVGSRALMLGQRVSVASMEGRITELESMGRTVLLVALGGHLIGVIGLQDGLRPGARAAVQHLFDVGVEPILLSGDSRETCEALGRTLDISHIRPEVLPSDRGEEIKRLNDAGASVATLGRSAHDELALAASSVAISLGTAGSNTAEWNVQLAGDDVRDGAYAIRLAHRSRQDTLTALALCLAPALAGAIAVTFGAPLGLAPAMALVGASAAFAHVRGRRD